MQVPSTALLAKGASSFAQDDSFLGGLLLCLSEDRARLAADMLARCVSTCITPTLWLAVGMTSDIEGRILQHKNGIFEGYSKKYNCTRLVWFERHAFVSNAIAREKQLKGWSRLKKINLIERENPTWLDLSEEWGKPVKLFGEL